MQATMADIPKELHIQHASPYGVNRKTRRDWGIHFKKKRGSGITKKSPTSRVCATPSRKSEALVDRALAGFRAYFARIAVPEEYRTKHRTKKLTKAVI